MGTHANVRMCVHEGVCKRTYAYEHIYIQNKTLSLGLLKNYTVGIFYLNS